MKNNELSNLCYQLSIVFKSGLPIADGIKVLATDYKLEENSEILNFVADKLDSGESISESFGYVEKIPQYMKDLICIGEQTGKLPMVFEELSVYYMERAEFSKKMKSAITYPGILFGMMTFVIGILIFKVLPIFNNLFESLGAEIPKATMIIYDAANSLKYVFSILFFVILLLIIITLLSFKIKGLEKLREILFGWIPFVKRLNNKNNLVKFTSALNNLINSGYPLEIAIEKAVPIVEDTKFKELINRSSENRDINIDDLEPTGIFPQMFFKMTKLGIKTGTLGEALKRFTKIYKDDLNRDLNRVSDMVEPILVSIMSIIIGVILVLTLLPLIGIISAIG